MRKTSIAMGTLCVGLAALASYSYGNPISISPSKTLQNSAHALVHKNGTISVLYAGSMTANIENDIAPQFLKDTGIQIEGEGAGSSQLAEEIKSGLRQPDVFISASPSVNQKDLMGSANNNLVMWYLTFAKDQLVIAYNPKSKFADALKRASEGKESWVQAVTEKGLLLGRTDPKLDPKGASTVIMYELAEKLYHSPGLANLLMGGSVENAKQVFPEESLLAQLNTGQMDAVVAYKHEAVDWHLPYISLPSPINLGDPNESKNYATASVDVGNGVVTKGAPIVFTVTIPTSAKHEQQALKFVQYLVSGRGHQLLMQEGFTPTNIEVGGVKAKVPAVLQKDISGSYS